MYYKHQSAHQDGPGPNEIAAWHRFFWLPSPDTGRTTHQIPWHHILPEHTYYPWIQQSSKSHRSKWEASSEAILENKWGKWFYAAWSGYADARSYDRFEKIFRLQIFYVCARRYFSPGADVHFFPPIAYDATIVVLYYKVCTTCQRRCVLWWKIVYFWLIVK